MPKVAKSREKSPPAPGRPFQRGGPQGPGRGPAKGAPNAGRPPKDAVDRCVAIYGTKAIPFLEQVIDGTPMVKVRDADGNETGQTISVNADTRIRAAQQLGTVARLIGARVEVEHRQEKPFVVVLRSEKRSEREE